MYGSHCLKTYSQTQDTIALSSVESELYGILKAATMRVGIKSLLGNLDSFIDSASIRALFGMSGQVCARGGGVRKGSKGPPNRIHVSLSIYMYIFY